MTIYKPIQIEADTAAETAVALVNGETRRGRRDDRLPGRQVRLIFDPIVVTKDNVKDTVIKDGFYTPSDICTADYAAACKAAGIS